MAERKRCSKCQVDKALSDFHRSSACPDGLYPSCKVCKRIQLRASYHADLKSSRAARRAYRLNNIEKERERDRKRGPSRNEWRRNWTKKSEKYKSYATAFKASHKARYPERYSAIWTLNNAFQLGKIARPSSCACSNLGNCYGPLNAHHEDYARPLHFVPLCRGHHLQVHRLGVLRANDGSNVIAPPKPSETAS